MKLATEEAEAIRQVVLAWHMEQAYYGYNYVRPITEWELNKAGLTLDERKVK